MLNLVQLNRNIRSIRRYRQIGSVLFKYGFDQLLEYLNLSHFIARGKRIFRRSELKIAQLSPAERMRLALEELGPSFIKLGQLLSTRPDVLPQSYITEFAKLQDMVPSFSFEEVRNQIRAELGGEIEELFSCFETDPIAAASIAQVHRARLASGEAVVVKVRRPAIVELVETDIDVLMGLALLAERHLPGSDIYDPVGLVREFARTIRREMDFSREGHTIEKIAANFAGDKTLYFPKVFWEKTSKGALTLEFIDGIKVSDLPALEVAGLDRALIARRGADAFLKMVLVHGFFHGDPHPGNVFILPENIICLLDYGMVGRLDDQLKAYLLDLLLAITGRDVDEVVSLLSYSGDLPDQLNMRALKRDLSEFIDNHLSCKIPARPDAPVQGTHHRRGDGTGTGPPLRHDRARATIHGISHQREAFAPANGYGYPRTFRRPRQPYKKSSAGPQGTAQPDQSQQIQDRSGASGT